MSGLTASGLVLKNGADTVLVSSGATTFSFVQRYTSGTFDVEVDTQPAGLECAPTQNTGTFGTNDSTNVQITCTPASYTLTGTITGLTASGLVLTNGSDSVSPVSGATSFTLPGHFGASYMVLVTTQPVGLECTPSNNAGVVLGNVTGIAVSCVPGTYTASGSIAGLKEAGLTLTLNGEVLTPAASDTSYRFHGTLTGGDSYSITHVDPPHSTCTVSNASGTVTGDITADVSCTYVDAVVTASTPTEGDQEVSEGITSITLTFDRAMDTTSTFALTGGPGALGTPVWSNGDTTVTLPVTTALVRGNDYVLDLSGVKDAQGYAVSSTTLGDGKLNFRTTFKHSEPIIDLNPLLADGGAGVYVASYVAATEPINDTTPSCQATNNGDLAFKYTTHGAADGLSIDLSGSTIGAGDTVLTVVSPTATAGVCDDDTGAGNQSLVTLSACFTAGQTLDLIVDVYGTTATWGTNAAKFTITEKLPASTTPTTFVPANGSTTARVSDNLSVTFPTAIDVAAGGTITASGSQSGPQVFTVGTANVLVSNSNKTLIVDPALFTVGETVTVTGHGLRYADCQGQALPDFTWSFTASQAALPSEAEANNTCGTANTLPALPALIAGSLNTLTDGGPDSDFYAFTISAYSDLTLQTFDSNGPNTCAAIDTVISFYDSTCGTSLLDRDQGGVGNCSNINATSDAVARHVAPGTYYVKVKAFSASSNFDYTLNVLATATCGNNVKEGSEDCDGTDTVPTEVCTASCRFQGHGSVSSVSVTGLPTGYFPGVGFEVTGGNAYFSITNSTSNTSTGTKRGGIGHVPLAGGAYAADYTQDQASTALDPQAIFFQGSQLYAYNGIFSSVQTGTTGGLYKVTSQTSATAISAARGGSKYGYSYNGDNFYLTIFSTTPYGISGYNVQAPTSTTFTDVTRDSNRYTAGPYGSVVSTTKAYVLDTALVVYDLVATTSPTVPTATGTTTGTRTEYSVFGSLCGTSTQTTMVLDNPANPTKIFYTAWSQSTAGVSGGASNRICQITLDSSGNPVGTAKVIAGPTTTSAAAGSADAASDATLATFQNITALSFDSSTGKLYALQRSNSVTATNLIRVITP